MSSNFPPGVTGREDAFGPSWEGDAERTCGFKGVSVEIISDRLKDACAQLVRAQDRQRTGDTPGRFDLTLEQAATRLAFAARIPYDEVDMDECPFEGTVDLARFSDGLYWTCPLCKTQHIEDGD